MDAPILTSLNLSPTPTRSKLYDLIWKRTLASQMEQAKMERTTVDIASADGQVELRATGQVVTFDGFMKVYEEGRDDVVDDDDKMPAPDHAGRADDQGQR